MRGAVANVFTRMANWIRPRASRGPEDDFWYTTGPGRTSTSGVVVTDDVALSVSAVFACVRVLSETLASLPLFIYRRTDERSKERARDYYLYPILHDQPNSWQTSFDWRELGMIHLALRGNFFCEIVPGNGAPVDQLRPLHPDKVKLSQNPSGQLKYEYSPPDGGERRIIPQERMLHIRGLSLDGVRGVSVLTYARNTIGAASAQETHGASLFANGSIPPFFITFPQALKGEQAVKNFREGWRALHAGPQNAHNPPILENGGELKALGLTNEDSQWIESQQHGVEQIARFFRVPPHLIGHLLRSTYSNIEQQSIEFVTHTVRPWCVRWEQAFQRDLIWEDETYFAEFLVDGLLRGDTLSRFNAYSIAVQAKIMLPNECRERENLNPIPEGDEFPLNVANPTGRTDTPPAQREEPPPPKPEEALALPPPVAATSPNPPLAVALPPPPPAKGIDLRPLITDCAERIAAALTKDSAVVKRLSKAKADPERFIAWFREEFLPKYLDYARRVLTPVCVVLAREDRIEAALIIVRAAAEGIGLEAAGGQSPVKSETWLVDGLLESIQGEMPCTKT